MERLEARQDNAKPAKLSRSQQLDLGPVLSTPVVPDKLQFKIGEVADLLGVKPHVLRYWETEFGALRPDKSRTNQRVYQRSDVQLLLTIKRLLYAEGFTIAGAKKRLRQLARERKTRPADQSFLNALSKMRRELESLLAAVDD